MASTHTKNHDYHIIDPSPWPFLGGIGAFLMAFGGVAWMRAMNSDSFELLGFDLARANYWIFLIGVLVVLYTMYAWWSDTIKEAHEGHHTRVVNLHLRYGMMMFIASELMFFVAWFWAFFDASLFPADAVQVSRSEFTGGQWPPQGVEVINPFHLPLYNTIILLLSGTTLTWAHHALLKNDRRGLVWGLAITVALGVLFTYVQVYEYMHSPYDFAGSIFSATFYMATGFHGFHVFIGTVFLTVCLFRAMAGHFTPQQHFGLEGAAWYWHFVDAVWLFLFVFIYVWASWGAPIAAH